MDVLIESSSFTAIMVDVTRREVKFRLTWGQISAAMLPLALMYGFLKSYEADGAALVVIGLVVFILMIIYGTISMDEIKDKSKKDLTSRFYWIHAKRIT